MNLLKGISVIITITSCIIFSIQACAINDKSSKFIKYKFSYERNDDKNLLLNVSLSFRGDSSDETKIELPYQIAEISDLYTRSV